ncbi:MAG TPA: hypothetical protein DIU35_04785, partial [Candidatus Latescibacteria bacterium]|nr:hypothetical protein [Candidatus Latescibacterota bacterium]
MSSLRILTFNWHDPYLFTLAKTRHRFEVADWMVRGDGTRGWDLKKRPLPDNLNLLRAEGDATDLLQDGSCDLVLCHTLQDLNFITKFNVPAIFLTHNALNNDALDNHEQMTRMRDGVNNYLKTKRGTFAAISQMKL